MDCDSDFPEKISILYESRYVLIKKHYYIVQFTLNNDTMTYEMSSDADIFPIDIFDRDSVCEKILAENILGLDVFFIQNEEYRCGVIPRDLLSQFPANQDILAFLHSDSENQPRLDI